MYTLYCRPNAGSLAVEAMLAVCGAEFETHDLERDASGALPDYFHRINPKAEVPTLRLPDDSIMTESAAIMICLADIHPEAGLAPAISAPQRPHFLRWMVYLAASVYQSDLRLYYPERFTDTPSECSGMKSRATTMMAREFEILSDAIGKGPFILGERMSAVDLYAAMLFSWAPDVAALFAKHPNIEGLYAKVTAVPAVERVWRRNGM
jgi:glutathione S-transferase